MNKDFMPEPKRDTNDTLYGTQVIKVNKINRLR